MIIDIRDQLVTFQEIEESMKLSEIVWATLEFVLIASLSGVVTVFAFSGVKSLINSIVEFFRRL